MSSNTCSTASSLSVNSFRNHINDVVQQTSIKPSVQLRQKETDEVVSHSERSSAASNILLNNNHLMRESISTMNSSLERSLELAAFHSDGLSDKESQVQHVKQLLQSNRVRLGIQKCNVFQRNSSQNANLPENIYETSSSDADDAVHC